MGIKGFGVLLFHIESTHTIGMPPSFKALKIDFKGSIFHERKIKMEKKENLYIPMGIKEKNEFWEGFGNEELKGATIFILINLVINIVLNLLIGSIFFFVAFSIISIATGGMIFTKGNTNLSVVNQIENMRCFSKSQKKYYYKSLNEWT